MHLRSPNYGDSVTLNLRKGNDVNNLALDSKIAAGIPNSGSYTWTVPKSLDGTTYAIEIISGNAANYSPQFEVNATGKQGDAKPESAVLKPASATVAPSAVPTGASNSTMSISKSIDSAKASASVSGTKTVPSGAPTAVAGDSASSKTQGSIIAVMVGLMAAVALLN